MVWNAMSAIVVAILRIKAASFDGQQVEVLYQPCADSGTPAGVFSVLRPRQQFEWAATAAGSHVRFLATVDSVGDNNDNKNHNHNNNNDNNNDRAVPTNPLCLTSGAPGARPNQLFLSSCIEPMHPTQNFSTSSSGGSVTGSSSHGQDNNATGLQVPSGGEVCSELSCVTRWMSRNMRAGIIDNSSCVSGASCVSYDKAAQVFRSLPSIGPHGRANGEPNLCLSVGAPVRPCDHPSPAAGYPMCDVTSTIEARVTDLVRRISPRDRPAQLVNDAPSIDALWLPAQDWWNEALHGLLLAGAVAFPSAISSAASLNRTLFYEIGSAVGTEARVVDNLGISRGHTFWAPNLNIFRDPRWGRGQETPGEDPSLNAAYGSNFISGFQGQKQQQEGQKQQQEQGPKLGGLGGGVDGGQAHGYAHGHSGGAGSMLSDQDGGDTTGSVAKLKASACAKHFFGYSLENCYEARDNCRMNFNANLTQQEIEDTYLPAFEAAVKVGKVSGLMCSENAINGVPACANSWAMNTVARKSWGGDFYVTGDCGAVSYAVLPYPTENTWPAVGINVVGGKGHGYKLPPNTSFESAGLDSDCNANSDNGGPQSIATGTAADQATALARLFRTEFRLGRFDPVGASTFNKLGLADLGSRPHQALAREACQQSIVLLKNANSTLPLSTGSSTSSSSTTSSSSSSSTSSSMQVAMIGPNWEVKEGGYSGRGSGGMYTLSAPNAIAGYLNRNRNLSMSTHAQPPPTVIPGCEDSACESDGDGFAAAVAAAEAADVVLVAVGIDDSFEGENLDRRALSGKITLPGFQTKLVTAVAAVAKHPVIVVVTGSSVDLSVLKSHPRVGAILWRGYCGEAAGQATADVLFGSVSPSGRLTQTFYPQSFLTAWKPGVDPYTGAITVPRNASYFDHHVRPNATTGNPGRTHRFYTGTPVYSFGEGMGYTSFSYVLLSEPRVQVGRAAVAAYASGATKLHRFIRPQNNDPPPPPPPSTPPAAASAAPRPPPPPPPPPAAASGGRDRDVGSGSSSGGGDNGAIYVVRVRVTNTGDAVASAHSVLCFAAAPTAGVDGAPLRTLIDFEKVFLEPGESTVVDFNLVLHDFTLTRSQGGLDAVGGDWTIAVGDLRTTITVE